MSEKKPPAKRKGGRPKKEITPEVISKAEALAAQGLTQEQIAQVLGMGLSTLMEKKASYSELSDAIKRGQAKGIATITNALFNKAKNGDNTAMIFYLKARGGWSEKQEVQLSGTTDAPLMFTWMAHNYDNDAAD